MNTWFPAAVLIGLSLCMMNPAESSQTGTANDVTKIDLLPPGPHNVRNSEGDFIQLKNGRILFIYSHFVEDCKDGDNGDAYLASRFSSDGGKTWSKEDEIVVKNEGGMNVMSVSLLRLKDGRIALFYLRKNSISDCRPMMRVSEDEGGTWSAPTCCIDDEIGYYVVNNSRVIQLKSGRLVMPTAMHKGADGTYVNRADAMCYYSDDIGKTWKRSSVLHLAVQSGSGLQEPLVVELKDGRLMLLARTDQGCQMRSWSDDGGATWSPIERSNIISPLSPATLKRIPKTGDLMLVWNDHENVAEADKWKRTPLTVAVSSDEGKSWRHKKTIENNVDGWYCYSAAAFVGDRVLLAYCGSEPPTGYLRQTRITCFDLEWLYR
jgi:hypothetical protein